MPYSAEVPWDPSVWEDINHAVVAEIGKVRVAQKVFPTTVFDTSPTEVPSDVIDFRTFSMLEGQTKPFVEIFSEFRLSAAQVAKEPQLKTAKALARMAAKAIALGEDTRVFQGDAGQLPAGVEATGKAGNGLLGEAAPIVDNTPDTSDVDPIKVSVPIEVDYRGDRPPIWGENLFSAVAEGIAKLTAKGQAPKYALFLPVDAFADTFSTLGNDSLVTTAERIRPLVAGGFCESGTLPGAVYDQDPAKRRPGLGLLVALGGDPTTLYVGREAEAEFSRKSGADYAFRVVERVQFVARDPRAYVLLKLKPAPPRITHILVEPSESTLNKTATAPNHTEQLAVIDSNGDDRTDTASYESSDQTVTVSSTGLMTAVNSTPAPLTPEKQTVTITGTPTGGTFTLRFKGQTTAGIKHDANAPGVQDRLVELSTIGPGNVAVTGGPGPGAPWVVTFAGRLANKNVPLMTASGTGLSGGSSPGVAVATTQAAVPPVTVKATLQEFSASCTVTVP